MSHGASVATRSLDLPRYTSRPRIYVIACQPRSGSHFMAHLLRENGSAGVPYEYFHPRHWQEWTRRLGNKNPLFAFRMLCQLRTSENGRFGLKAHWHQFAGAIQMDLEQELREADYVYLTRDNLLDQAISHRIATQTGVWSSGQKPTGEAVFSFERILQSLRFILQERDRWEQFFALTGITPHRVTYENLLADPDREMERLCAHLGIQWTGPSVVQSSVQRSTINREWKARFHEVARLRHDQGHFWKSEFV